MADSDRRDAAESTPSSAGASPTGRGRDDSMAESAPAPDGAADEVVDDKVELAEEFADQADAGDVPELDASQADEVNAGNGELVSVGAPGTRSTRERGSSRIEKKGRATPRQRTARTGKRTGPIAFVSESIAELRKVVYPTGPQLLNYFVVVLIFVLFIIAFVSLLDLGFGWAVLKVFS